MRDRAWRDWAPRGVGPPGAGRGAPTAGGQCQPPGGVRCSAPWATQPVGALGCRLAGDPVLMTPAETSGGSGVQARGARGAAESQRSPLELQAAGPAEGKPLESSFGEWLMRRGSAK